MNRRALIFVFAPLLFLCIDPATTQRPTQEDVLRIQCAFDLSSIVSDAARAGYAIAEAVVDCSLNGIMELSCASDITDLIRRLADTASLIAKVLVSCDAIGNECTYWIIQCLTVLSWLSNVLIAAAIDCITDPFLCSYDVVNALDKANLFVTTVFETDVCPQVPPPLHPDEPELFVLSPFDALQAAGIPGSDSKQFYERRLLGAKGVTDYGNRGNVTESVMERFSYNATEQASVMTLFNKFFGSVAKAKTLEEQHAEMQKIREQVHVDVMRFREFVKAIDPKEKLDPRNASAALVEATKVLRDRLVEHVPLETGDFKDTLKGGGVNDTLKVSDVNDDTLKVSDVNHTFKGGGVKHTTLKVSGVSNIQQVTAMKLVVI